MNQFETPEWGEENNEKWSLGISEQSNVKEKKNKTRERNKYPKGFLKANAETETKTANPSATLKSPESKILGETNINSRLTPSSKKKRKKENTLGYEETEFDSTEPPSKSQRINGQKSLKNSVAHSDKIQMSEKRKISGKFRNNLSGDYGGVVKVDESLKSSSVEDSPSARDVRRKRKKNKVFSETQNKSNELPAKLKKMTEKSTVMNVLSTDSTNDSVPQGKPKKKKHKNEKNAGLERTDVDKPKGESSAQEVTPKLNRSQRRRALKKLERERKAKEDPNFVVKKRKRNRKKKKKSSEGIEVEKPKGESSVLEATPKPIPAQEATPKLTPSQKRRERKKREREKKAKENPMFLVNKQKKNKENKGQIIAEDDKAEASPENRDLLVEDALKIDDLTKERNLESSKKSDRKRKKKRKSVENANGSDELNKQSNDSVQNESMEMSSTSFADSKPKKKKCKVKDENVSENKTSPSTLLDVKLANEDEDSLEGLSNLDSRQKSEVDTPKVSKKKGLSLRDKMEEKLKGARFRFLNEQLYNSKSEDTNKYFLIEPNAFKAYHEGYKQQLNQWPVKPIDLIIRSLKKKPSNLVIADFGCGEAELSKALPNKVHSFDHVALNERVTVCDMAHTTLSKGSVDVVVFCLSLMGNNLSDYIVEANRVLKMGGLMKIAEVESRFDDVNKFVKLMGKFGFLCTRQDSSNDYFYLFDFRKEKNIKEGKVLPSLELRACSYKKR